MSKEQSMFTTDTSAFVVMKRKAVNSSGYLGSLYDGCRDRLVVPCNVSVPGQPSKSNEPTKCVVINGNSDVSRNVLRMIDVEDDLRVSLLLNSTPRIGTVTILNDSYRINEHTRLLYYSWVDREEQISEEGLNNLKWDKLLKNTTSATHMITGISFGINVLVMLQLPSEPARITEIDPILQRIADSLSNGTNLISLLTPEENDFLTKNIKTTVYSNIPDLMALKQLSYLLHQIDLIKRNSNQCLPVIYFLRPLPLLFPQHTGTDMTFRTLPPELNHHLEEHVIDQRTILITFKSLLQDNMRKVLSGYLRGRLYGVNQQHLRIEKKKLVELQRLTELLISFRSDQITISLFKDALSDKEQTTLRNDNNELIQNLKDLEAKASLISDLQNRYFKYCNVIEYNIDKHDNERTIQTKLMTNKPFLRILCSNDTFNRNNRQQLNKLLSDLIVERQKNPHLQLIYADFSYSSYNLHHMTVLSSPHRTNSRVLSTQASPSSVIPSPSFLPLSENSPPPVEPIRRVHHPTKSLPTDNTTNILLLGETGVGKSTFINAFANYLKFNSLTQAQNNEPIVIIPVSFIITIGDNFEERTIKFGESDSSSNENFNGVGQSVTQHCRSYVFDLKENGRKIRIIDTPGFGDNRGLEQDDQNMEHILQYINNLTHLNAICFLLKPNSSRLNMFFRTCLTQLFSFLAPTARGNVIFCFTNGRSTFYTPGDTAPLLKTMLTSSSITDIPFKKQNTFCFDSESFRYLVALRDKIPFTEDDKREYEKSWSTSETESKRLVDYIHRSLRPYYTPHKWQSMKHAQFQISHLIRPILEAIRNILRNLLLTKMDSAKTSIELHPKPALRPVAICISCKRQPIQVGHFWIMPDDPHQFTNKCHTCQCSITRHKSIDYELEYRAKNKSSSYRPNEMNDMLRRLYFASAEFSHFLIHGARSTKDDLFILGLLQMIDEEKEIGAEKESHQMNSQLIHELEKVRQEYEQRMHEVAANQDRKTLRTIYEQINTIRSYPEIREQMVAIKQGQEAILKQHEVVL